MDAELAKGAPVDQSNNDVMVELRARLVVIQTYLRLLNIELFVNPPPQPGVVEHLHRVQNHVEEVDQLLNRLTQPTTPDSMFNSN